MDLEFFFVLVLLFFLFGLGLFLFIRRQAPEYEKNAFDFSKVDLFLDETKTLSVHYRLEGSARNPLIILIHGLGANLNCWRRLFPLLTQDFRVLAFDLPGFGLTPNPDSIYGENSDSLSQLVTALLEALKLDHRPTYLVGNSLGGVIALSLMEKEPKRFKKAFLINPALSRKLVKLKLHRHLWLARPIARLVNRSALAWLYARTLSKPKQLEPDVLDHLAQNYIRNPSGVRNFARYVGLIEKQVVPELDYTHCLFLFSGEDRVVTPSHHKRIQKLFPHANILFHPVGGHQFQEDEPEWLSQQIKKFFLSS